MKIWFPVTSLAILMSAVPARADTVVTDGRFTNVYVYPDPDKETWEQHLAGLPASIKPADWQKFSRQSIDSFTQTLMDPAWPNYFGALRQYGGINPPRFFGSHVASQACVNAALKDLHNGVLQRSTAATLANCHINGMDPSPQVNLILSPEFKIADPLSINGPDECSKSGSHDVAYHSKDLNTPDFAALPTAMGCAPDFDSFTESISHEDVEMLSDPGGFGHGGAGGTELGDRCQSQDIRWKGYNVQRYRSDNDQICWPLNFPAGSTTTTWVLAEGNPQAKFTGDFHTLTLSVPAGRQVTTAPATEIQIWIQTGDHDLPGGNDNADVTLTFAGGTTVTKNINAGRGWGGGQTHIARLTLPASGPAVKDIQSVTIATHFSGGVFGHQWNVNKVGLMVAFKAGSATSQPATPVVHTWLDRSGGPLIRFTGDVHDLLESIPLGQDVGVALTDLELIISVGNDDLRGGSHAQDNCDVTIGLNNGQSITLKNVNNGKKWDNWTNHTVKIPLPAGGLRGGDVKNVKLHTGFGGGFDGDNWNVQRIQLIATLKP